MDQELVIKQVEAIIEPQAETTESEVKKLVTPEPELVTPLQEFYGIEEPTEKQREQLAVVWKHFDSLAKNRGEALKLIRNAQLNMVQPEVGQTRLSQLYNYVRILNELESVKNEKEAYEAK